LGTVAAIKPSRTQSDRGQRRFLSIRLPTYQRDQSKSKFSTRLTLLPQAVTPHILASDHRLKNWMSFVLAPGSVWNM